MDVVTLGAALNGSKKYTDQVAQSLMGGVHYRGSVSYYADLPANPAEGDSYTVKYAGSSGSVEDGTEYVWGYDTDTSDYAWISFSKDAYSKAETDALLSGKQAALSQAQLNAVNSGIDSEKVEQIETNKNNILLIDEELSEVTESGNLVLGKIKHASVGPEGIVASEPLCDLWYAQVEQGQAYAITSNEQRIALGYFEEIPRISLRTYNLQRVITEAGVYSVTAPITGYIAFRSLTGYEYAQIEKGTTKTPYKDYIITAIDYDARSKIEILSDPSTVSSDIAMFENIGFCGDSYMAGMIVVSENPTVTAENQNLCWGKILERTHGINASIFAKGGVKASDFINDTDCLPALLAASAQQLYVISLGHNDAFHQTSVSSFKTSYESILDSIIEHAPNAKIILCRQSRGYGDLNNGAELNEAISEIGADYGLPVLNPEDDIYLSSSIYTSTQVHRHPTFAGYAGMAKAFDRQFAKATVDYANYFKDYTGLSE